MHKLIRLGLAVFVTIVATASAQAGKPRSVLEAFSGQVLISTAPLKPAGETQEEIVASFRKDSLQAVAPIDASAEELSWSFYFTAFLDKASHLTELSLDVYAADGDKHYITSKRMMGIDPKIRILAGDMSISEEDGVKRGGKYRLVLTGQVGNREVTFASTTLTLR
jgi:hypothetical protein